MELDVSAECYLCKGTGKRNKRIKQENRRKKNVEIVCSACDGKGVVVKTKGKDSNGSWKRKKNAKSFPSFIAPGPLPLYEENNNNDNNNNNNLLVKGDEELCYLIGNWKIFQKLNKHRYSTDDIVTSWIACEGAKKFGYLNPNILDIGCGIGSVLLCNAWLFPASPCTGIEALSCRYEQALRSIQYNVGRHKTEQNRVSVYNLDIRDTLPHEGNSDTVDSVISRNIMLPHSYDLITGTPPYFPLNTGVQTPCKETNHCLFELSGGIEEYCACARQYLRKPLAKSVATVSNSPLPVTTTEKPSLFVVCFAYICMGKVYEACAKNNMVILQRLDCIPKVNKTPLFCVFIIVLQEWMEYVNRNVLEWKNRTDNTPLFDTPFDDSNKNVQLLTVRESDNQHTLSYQYVLSCLGKPSSANKEIY